MIYSRTSEAGANASADVEKTAHALPRDMIYTALGTEPAAKRVFRKNTAIKTERAYPFGTITWNNKWLWAPSVRGTRNSHFAALEKPKPERKTIFSSFRPSVLCVSQPFPSLVLTGDCINASPAGKRRIAVGAEQQFDDAMFASGGGKSNADSDSSNGNGFSIRFSTTTAAITSIAVAACVLTVTLFAIILAVLQVSLPRQLASQNWISKAAVVCDLFHFLRLKMSSIKTDWPSAVCSSLFQKNGGQTTHTNVKYNKLGKTEGRRRMNRTTTVSVPADDANDPSSIVHSDDDFDDGEESTPFARTWETPRLPIRLA